MVCLLLFHKVFSTQTKVFSPGKVLGRIKGGLTLSVGPSWKHTCEIKICLWFFYRTNYFIILTLMLVIALVRRPLALISVIFAALSIGCLNDSFAVSVSETLRRAVRRISPPAAAKLQPPVRTAARGQQAKGTVYICGQDRRFFVVGLISVSALLWFLASAINMIFLSLALGILCT
ncbi:hypothetical protein CY35_06G095100 [Sphagnum magellanicum]|nr:hypothetical protein CY35_06G095100 [Sphagnum magellanicum]